MMVSDDDLARAAAYDCEPDMLLPQGATCRTACTWAIAVGYCPHASIGRPVTATGRPVGLCWARRRWSRIFAQG